VAGVSTAHRPDSAAATRRGEALIEFLLRASAAIGIITTVGIVTVLLVEAILPSTSSPERVGQHQSFHMRSVSFR